MVAYAPKNQLLISGGRKGFTCLFDLRQRQQRHVFQSHDSAVKAIAIDPTEEYFITGSAEGNIKVSVCFFKVFNIYKIFLDPKEVPGITHIFLLKPKP